MGIPDPPALERQLIERAIKWAVVDVLIMRQELARHDVSDELRDAILAAAAPAFVAWEAARPLPSPEPWKGGTGGKGPVL